MSVKAVRNVRPACDFIRKTMEQVIHCTMVQAVEEDDDDVMFLHGAGDSVLGVMVVIAKGASASALAKAHAAIRQDLIDRKQITDQKNEDKR